jgi:hypothetical protein
MCFEKIELDGCDTKSFGVMTGFVCSLCTTSAFADDADDDDEMTLVGVAFFGDMRMVCTTLDELVAVVVRFR